MTDEGYRELAEHIEKLERELETHMTFMRGWRAGSESRIKSLEEKVQTVSEGSMAKFDIHDERLIAVETVAETCLGELRDLAAKVGRHLG